jgi:hypothetical protein
MTKRPEPVTFGPPKGVPAWAVDLSHQVDGIHRTRAGVREADKKVARQDRNQWSSARQTLTVPGRSGSTGLGLGRRLPRK